MLFFAKLLNTLHKVAYFFLLLLKGRALYFLSCQFSLCGYHGVFHRVVGNLQLLKMSLQFISLVLH